MARNHVRRMQAIDGQNSAAVEQAKEVAAARREAARIAKDTGVLSGDRGGQHATLERQGNVLVPSSGLESRGF